jgi:hypothetical protein
MRLFLKVLRRAFVGGIVLIVFIGIISAFEFDPPYLRWVCCIPLFFSACSFIAEWRAEDRAEAAQKRLDNAHHAR